MLTACREDRSYTIDDFYGLIDHNSKDSAILVGIDLIERNKVSFTEFTVIHSYLKDNLSNDQSEIAEFGLKLAQSTDDSIKVYLAMMGDHFLDNRTAKAEDCAKNILARDLNLDGKSLYSFEAHYILGLVHERNNDNTLAVSNYLNAIPLGRMQQDSCFFLHGIYRNLLNLGLRTNDSMLIKTYTPLEAKCKVIEEEKLSMLRN
jgi:hypothetical protein